MHVSKYIQHIIKETERTVGSKKKFGKTKANEILKGVETEGFEHVWLESPRLLPKPLRRLKLVIGKKGMPHPLFDLLQVASPRRAIHTQCLPP